MGAGRAGKRQERAGKRGKRAGSLFFGLLHDVTARYGRAYANGRTTERANVYRPLFQART